MRIKKRIKHSVLAGANGASLGLACMALLIGLTGCANNDFRGLRLHNPSLAEKASAVEEAVDKVDLKAQFQAERVNQEKMLARELSVVEEFSAAMRDTTIRALLERRPDENNKNEALSSKVRRQIGKRLKDLTGDEDIDDVKKVTALLKYRHSAIEEELQPSRREFIFILKLQPPVFDQNSDKYVRLSTADRNEIIKTLITANPNETEADIEESLTDLLGAYENACVKIVALNKNLGVISGGANALLIAAGKEYTDTLLHQSALKAKLAAGKAEYLAAVEAVRKAQENLAKDPSADAEESLRKRIDAVRKALQVLPEVAGVFGRKEAVEKQIASIDVLLAAAGTPDDTESENQADELTPSKVKALAVVAQLPSFYGHAVEIATLRNTTSVNALILEKNRLQALRSKTNNEIKRGNKKIKLLRLKTATLEDEANQLLSALQHLDWAESENNNNPITFEDLMSKEISEDARRHNIMGTALYLATFTGHQRTVHEVEYRLIDLRHQAALDRSETALVLWQSAITLPIKSMVAYHNGGIKPDQIIELLKALGLGAIAVGVN